jgi:hypothetical protein
LKHIEASMRQWIDTMGVRPFVCITDRTIDITYQGHERSLQQTHAFGFIGEVQIELIYQTNDIPSPYQDFLAGAVRVSTTLVSGSSSRTRPRLSWRKQGSRRCAS